MHWNGIMEQKELFIKTPCSVYNEESYIFNLLVAYLDILELKIDLFRNFQSEIIVIGVNHHVHRDRVIICNYLKCKLW